jgi:hypothetical protein
MTDLAPEATQEQASPPPTEVPQDLVPPKGRKVPTYEEIQKEIAQSSPPKAEAQVEVENAFTISLTLGKTNYQISKLVSKRAREWRGKMRAPLDEILAIMGGMQEFEINSVQDLVILAREIQGTILSAPDTIIDLVFSYSPQLAAQRNQIEEETYDEQFFEAFIKLVKVAFPLDQLMRYLGPSKASTP